MSIKSEIERIKIGVQDIKTAIRRKNIPVPDGAKIDTLFSYIDQIPSGGSSSGQSIVIGTTKSPVINTGLNKIESFSLYADLMSSEGLIQTSYTEGDSKINAIVCIVYSVNKICGNLTTTGFKVHGGTFEWIGEGSNYLFMENATYKWIAIGSR